MLQVDILYEFLHHNELEYFLNFISTNKYLYTLFKKNIRPNICHSILKPLSELHPNNTNICHPFDFWIKHIKIVWTYYYSLSYNRNVIFSFGDNSSLQRYRVHELTNIMKNIFPQYIKKTCHKAGEYMNGGYESDSYDEETKSWNYKGDDLYILNKRHYICMSAKSKSQRVQEYCIITIPNENINNKCNILCTTINPKNKTHTIQKLIY